MTWVIGLTVLTYVMTLYVRHQQRKGRCRTARLRAAGWTVGSGPDVDGGAEP